MRVDRRMESVSYNVASGVSGERVYPRVIFRFGLVRGYLPRTIFSGNNLWYADLPQEEGINTVCEAYEEFYQGNPPIPTRYLREMLSLV